VTQGCVNYPSHEDRQKHGLSRCSNIDKPGVVGGVDAGAGGVTDGGGTVPGTVDDRPGGNVVKGTGGIVVTVHIRFQTRSTRICSAQLLYMYNNPQFTS